MNKAPEERAAELLTRLTVEEKIYQLTAEMLFEVGDDYDEKRNPLHGSYRNPGHFMHQGKEKPASPAEVCERINSDVKRSIEAQPHGIPPIENGEALHGAQWGMATNFPQPINLASTFDPGLVEKVADVIGRECDAVGVRQVFSPVVNLARDCRWGRTVETYGEDVKLSSDMGAAMCRGLEKNGVIATPKHFADNYSYGGRDSNYSETSERTMRETILPPFKACFDAGAQSVMAAYNSWEGIPCGANKRLLTDILRKDWGFSGFVVSDYWETEGLCESHKLVNTFAEACAASLKAGLDVILPFGRFDEIKEALEKGLISESEIDRNVLRVLTAKYRLGLFDRPFRDPAQADKTVRCKEHRNLALEAARESIVLLKNEGILPLDRSKVKRIGVFGKSADLIPIGSNYSGPYNAKWQGDDAPTCLQALIEYFGADAEIIRGESTDIESVALGCDINLFFTSIMEGEGKDRSNLKLPSITESVKNKDEGGLIVDSDELTVEENQEESILRLCKASGNTIVILLNGAPIDMTGWIDSVPAVIEAWYPGEQGARALAEILAGETNPSAKLPVTIPKSAGQLPLFYSYKPSGRGYAYCDDDGKPLYPFGYGLSYTSFEISGFELTAGENGAEVSFEIKNTGKYTGTETIQLYIGSHNCETVRPLKELKAYKRISLEPGQSKREKLALTGDDLKYYDAGMVYGLHNGQHTVMLGTSCEDIVYEGDLSVKDGKIIKG